MAVHQDEQSAFVLSVLQLFPPLIRESLILDPTFANRYGPTRNRQISFGDSGVWVQQAELFDGIRNVLADSNARPMLKDTTGMEWRLELIEKESKRLVILSHRERRIPLLDFSVLSPNQAERLSGFNQAANDLHLPEQEVSAWREILASRALTDDEVEVLHRDLQETPSWVAAAIVSEIEKGEGSLLTLVPRSERYFARLVGEYRQEQNISDYARVGAREHIRQLASWRAYDGFLLTLLLSSHSSTVSIIETDQLEEKDIIQAYEWLQKDGDRISQIGAIEIGLSILDKHPKIEPYVKSMIEQIRDDNVDDTSSRLHLLSALIILAEGELSRTKILREKPPFWRRLASIAQASLIERSLVKSHVDIIKFAERALQYGTQLFYLQTMVDLRIEPRWHPDSVSACQLKAELVGRILHIAQQNTTKIETSALRELLLGQGPESLLSLIKSPSLFFPGPLQGGLESQREPPVELLRKIEEQLSTDALELHSFAALVNSILVFRLDREQAILAAKALRAGKHQLKQISAKELLFSVMCGLATVAAVTRSDELAKEFRILTRRCRLESRHRLSAEEALWVGFIAAAAYSELTDWCEFVGEWVTELAFQPLEHDEMEKLHSHIEQLCNIVPELWRTCGRAEAALSAGMAM